MHSYSKGQEPGFNHNHIKEKTNLQIYTSHCETWDSLTIFWVPETLNSTDLAQPFTTHTFFWRHSIIPLHICSCSWWMAHDHGIINILDFIATKVPPLSMASGLCHARLSLFPWIFQSYVFIAPGEHTFTNRPPWDLFRDSDTGSPATPLLFSIALTKLSFHLAKTSTT